jgi:hypothetical protein
MFCYSTTQNVYRPIYCPVLGIGTERVWMVNGFSEHLQLITTNKHYALAFLHTLQFIRTYT